MTLAARVRQQLDRPLTEHERRVASVLLAMVLAAASAALVLTHPPSTATRSREHHGSAPASAQAPTGSVAVVPRAVTGTVDGFLVGYLRYLYGRGSASRVENATASFSRSLEQHPPRVPPGLGALHPRVLRLVAAPALAGEVAVTATVTDGEVVDYRISLFVTRGGGEWRVSGLDTGS